MDFFNTQENNIPFIGDGLDDDVYVFPASFAQQRFWFLDQFEPGSPYYNIPLAIKAKGDLDIGVLKAVLSEIIRRHESLRTSFFFYDGQPSQVIFPSIPTPFIFTDLRNLQSTQKEQKSKELAFSEARFSFQLQTGPLFRIHLLQLLEKEYIILLTMHHIISDGWSMSVFMREIFVLYEAFIRNFPSPLPDLSLQYADFTEWQRNWLSEGALEKQLSYWKNKLKDIPQVLEFPTDRPRPAIQSNIGANYSKKIPKLIMDKVFQFNKSAGVTMFMTLMTVFNVLIWRYSNQDDICIGTPIANRTRAEMENLIGLFINTLVIRTRIQKSFTFNEILDLVKSSSLEAFENQDIPFEMLVDALQPERDMSHSPVFQVMFILQNAQIQGKMKSSTNLVMEQIDLDAGTATFDITVAASEQSDGLSLSIEYNTDLFNSETVIRLLDHFEILLNGAINEPDLIIAKLPLLTPFEHNLTINEWNKTEKDFHRKNLCIQDLFEDQVEKYPDTIAVVIPEINNRPQKSISYIELNVRANIMGISLRNRGVTSDTLVAVCLDKSIEMIVSILAIIKAGGAYLPIDPLYPPERISFMLSDSGVRYVLTDRETNLKLPSLDYEAILIEDEWIDHNSLFIHPDINNLTHVSQPDNLVYMIYTSGSTGKAKGVRILHKNLVNAFLGWEHEYRLDNVKSHLQMANFSFDVFSGDFVRALCSGGKLVLCPRDYLLMPNKLFSLMLEENVDCAEFVPAVLRNLIQYLGESGQNLAFMKLLICGSDSWYSEEYKQFLKFCGPDTRLINSFGLTEATIDSTYFEGSVVTLIDKQIVPIGRPFPNVRLYVLDEFMQPVPIGVKGELYIGGKGVANGYHNRPELNQEKFVTDPFISQENSLDEGKLYRTGDATRYLADGNIEFMGRLDFQVKIRGFRIETGEIESVLRQYPGVQDVAVTSFSPGKQGDLSRPISPILVGYLTTDKTIDAIPWKTNCSIVTKRIDGSISHINLNTLTLYENGVGVEELPYIQETETPFEIYLNLPGHEEQAVFVGEIVGNLLDENRIQFKLVGDQVESIQRAIRILTEEGNLDIPDTSGGSWIIKVKAGCEIAYSDNEFVEGAIERIILSNSSYYFEVRSFYPMEVPKNVSVGIRTSFTEITGNKVRVNGTHLGISQGRDLIEVDLVGGIKNIINDIAWSYIKKVKINPNSVKSFLKTKLPDYMVPSIIMVIDAIPLTPNGKLDRQALPDPDWSIRDHEEEIILPRNPIEEAICGIWSQILGVDRIGVNENFFELGGHSLLATQVISRIKTNFRIDVPLKCIFESPTVASLAEQVDISLHKAEVPVLPPIRPIPIEISHIPLSFAQQRLWFLDKLEPNSSFYNLPETVRISGDLNISYLEMALNDVVKRHEALRTIFIEIDGVPQQIVLPELWIPLQVDEIDSYPFEERNRKLVELSSDEVKGPFDLSRGPLLRAKIIKTDAEEYSAILTMHHIIGDAWSSRILIQELAQFYRAHVGGKTIVIPPLEIQYADFSFWQRDWLKGEVLQGELSYWKSHLAGLPQLLDLPTDFLRPTIQTFNGNFISFEVPDHIREKIKKLAVKTNTTLFMLLISVFQVFLHRYSGQDEIAVGSPIANRNKAQIENLIGFFVNTLVIKAKIAEQDDFIDLVSQIKNNTLDAYAHQELPFEMVVDALQPERNLGHSPIFQVMFTLQESQTRGIDNRAHTKVGDISIIPMEVHSGTSKFDLTLFMSDEADRLGGAFEFNTDLFRFETIQRMIGHFLRLLEGITIDETQKLWDLPLLTTKERNQILIDWNDTFFNISIEENVVTLFEKQVETNPSAIAVTEYMNLGNSTWKEVGYTYLQVDQKANQLAHYLVKIGVEPEKLVGICMKRSISMVIGILATLKAGGAYLPMDPTYPIDRLTFMIEDSNCKAIITESDLLDRIHLAEGASVHLLPLDERWNEIEKEDDKSLKKKTTEHQLAYVIYTSGSTGRPKGAMIEHMGLTNYLAWCRKAYPLSDGVGSPVHSSISFDLTITSLFTPLISGKTVILLPEEKGIEGLSELLENQGGFSLIKITPAHLQVLGEQIGVEKSHGRTNAFIIGGENLLVEQISLWQKGSPETQYVNEYGPTETVVGCCVYWAPLGRQETGVIPIGRPIINTQLYVLDRHMQPLPVGIPGELYIGGLGVGRGYLNRSDLTNEKFLPDIFSSTPGSRLYRTGDLVKFLPDGNLICLGRMDFQLKIRGFRVELGEIEAEILQTTEIRDVCVWTFDDGTGKRLVAYLVAQDSGNPPDIVALKSSLREKLPDYMIPSAFIFMDSLPLTSNGKVDRKSLPLPSLTFQNITSDFIPARSPEEELVTSIWGSVLGLEKISIYDNFFELGGHSLLATQVVSRLRASFGLEIPLRYLFEYPTVQALAEKLISDRNSNFGIASPPIAIIDRSEPIPLSFAQQRLWFLDLLEPNKPYYNIPVVVKLKGKLDVRRLENAINNVIERHEILRTTFLSATDSKKPEINVVQFIHPFVPITIPLVDLSELSEPVRSNFSQTWIQEEILKPFDLSKGPLMRCKLLKMFDEEVLLTITTHHIITDDWSLGIFINELVFHYTKQSVPEELESIQTNLPIQYADFSVWQRNWLKDEVLEKQVEFWKDALADHSFILELPTDFQRPAVTTFGGGIVSDTLGVEMTDQLKKLVKETNSTMFMVLMAVYQILLYRYSDQKTFYVGTPIANRNKLDIEGLIGFFVNTMAIKADFNIYQSFNQLIQQIKSFSLGAYAHQDLPFEMLVDKIQPERDLSHTPIFQVMFVLQNAPRQHQSVSSDLSIEMVDAYDEIARFDLTLTVVESGENINFAFDYNVDLFTENSIRQMASRFKLILDNLIKIPETEVQRVSLLTEQERDVILYQWNNSIGELPTYPSVYHMFKSQVDNYPNNVALVYVGKDRREYSYQEVEFLSDRLAKRLIKSGIGPETIVAISVDRSESMVLCVLGVMKSGAAYLPIDPQYPRERIEFMIEDAQPGVILAHSSILDHLPSSQAEIIVIDDEWQEIDIENWETGRIHARPMNLAYTIYTSGSTGKPKGVLLQHQGLVNLVTAQTKGFGIKNTDRILQFASFSFDAAVSEIFMALASGASLFIAPQEIVSSPDALTELINVECINTITLPPTMLKVLQPENLPSLRVLISAGEACTNEIGMKWYQGRDMFNAYGPTEATIGPTYYPVTQLYEQELTIPIGKPIQNMQVYVLDSDKEAVPVGIPGELWISGIGIARGYLNRPELTLNKFITNPFIIDQSVPMYRTGDRVKWLPDGNLIYLGRIDEQVKIRGFRIEIGEIETVASQYPGVDQAVVIIHESPHLGKQLVLFVTTTKQKQTLDTKEMRQYMLQYLPDYMIPARIQMIESIPLTPNGKIDRKKLGLIVGEELGTRTDQHLDAARSPEEEIVVNIFTDILGIEEIGIHENFFELGGHSLLATQAISRLTNIFKREIPLRAIFEAPTAASLSSKIVQIFNSSNNEVEPFLMPQIRGVDPDGNSLAPLSFSQQRLWFLDQLEPGNASFNLPLSIRITNPLDYQALQMSVDFLVNRHESLRTRFVKDADGVGQQIIYKESQIHLKIIDLSYLVLEEREDEAHKIVQKFVGLPFDLSEDSLIRIYIIAISENDHVILVLMHHIISDGWSLNILINDLLSSYSAFLAGSNHNIENITHLPIQYADFSIWQRKWLAGKRLDDELEYWEQKLSDLPPILELPTDRIRPAIQSFRGKTIDFDIPTHIFDGIKSFSNRMGVTSFMTFMGIFEILLFRYSRQDDFAIGTPIANRHFTELEGLIGFFVNNLVIRADISRSQSFEQLIEYTRETLLEAYSHQNIPFEMLVDRLRVERNMSHSPLFQVVFVMQTDQLTKVVKAENDFGLRPFQADLQISKYDLTLSIVNSKTGFYASFEYNTDLFDEARIQRMVTHFLCLLEDTLDNPQKNLKQFSLLPVSERDLLLYHWPGTQLEFSDEINVIDIFERIAEENPNRIAVNDRGEEISYRELNSRASILANYLVNKGVTANRIVGVLLDKSSNVILSILAILKAGGIYLPLDPNFPRDRLDFMIDDSKEWMKSEKVIIISTSNLNGKISENEEVIFLDTDWSLIAKTDLNAISFLERGSTESHLAYVIYTSGSTGKPKGVALHHKGLRNMVEAYVRSFHLTTSDRVLQFASLSFDASIMEIFSALGSGASLFFTTRDVLLDPIELLEYLRAQRISMAILPPSLLRILPPDELNDLRILISAGENCSNEIARIWSKGRKFINGYGPTETTIGPTFYVVDPESLPGQGIPIGKTIPNMKAYILDEELQPVPIGVSGEICISGVGLAKEYLNQPELTAQKFIPNPWDPGTRLYKTGDLGRWLPDGNMEFSGRIDFQVKVRGFRIELGEIETLLENHPYVTQAVVLAREDINNQKRLIAYVIAQNDASNLSSNQLKDYLKENLPEYMVPSFIVTMDEFPLSSSGKVDRRALPNPEFSLKYANQEAALPQTEEEKALAGIWQTLLGIDSVSLADNFFELGGDSIMSIQMIARANTAGIRITPRQLFQYPTIGELVKVIGADEIESEQGLVSGTVNLTPIQLRFFEVNENHANHWNTSMMLTVFSELDMNVLIRTVETLMKEHDILRSRFEKNEVGWSLEIREQIDLSCVSQIDLATTKVEDRKELIEETCNLLQSTLDITHGPLFRIVKLNFGDQEPSRLLFIFHHLVFDGVSWRIFINDFQMVYNQIINEQEPKILPKTTSYKRWSEKLIEYAQSKHVIQEFDYWEKLVGKNSFIPVDFEGGTNRFIDADTVMFSLTEEETFSLIREIPHILVSKVDEVLFSIFIQCMLDWIGETSIIVEMLGHGREDVIPGIDLSRTIGWFSTAYPVLIEMNWKKDYQSLVSSIHKQLGMFEHSGFNFGVLRYFCNEKTIRDTLVTIPVPEISFNYLGQFDQTGIEPKENQLMAIPSQESRGWEQSPEGERESKLFVIASVTGRQMHWYFSYSKCLHRKNTIEKLANSINQKLSHLIRIYSSRKGI